MDKTDWYKAHSIIKRLFRKAGWVLASASLSLMTVQSSGLAALNTYEYNIIITPDQMPIIWPNMDVHGNPVDYGQATSLSAADLLETNICMTSPNCSIEAIDVGAVYYNTIFIEGVGDVIFYYDEMGNLVATQLKSEVAYDPSAETTNTFPGVQEVDLAALFGDYSQYAVGSTSADFNIDPSGSANYDIPIFTPPGVGDMQPTISISYNSQGGNGLLGMGFSVKGMSAITRCPHTRAQDGTTRPAESVTYTYTDAFCLDGQRLILVSGYNGYIGSEYRTEIDGFSRVRITDWNINGPVSFEVKTKAGQTFEYGKTSNSRIMLRGHHNDSTQDNQIVHLWAVENIYDVSANKIHFDYLTNDDISTGYRPDKITYGATISEASINFKYDEPTDRPDSSIGYTHGFTISSKKRMTAIEVEVGNETVRRYQFTYDPTATSKRSRLSAIQESSNAEACGTSNCLPPIVFDWTQGPTDLANRGRLATNQMKGWGDLVDRFNVMDFNGDGQSDIVIGPPGNGSRASLDGNAWWALEGNDEMLNDSRGLASEMLELWEGTLIRPVDMNADGTYELVAGPSSNGDWFALEVDDTQSNLTWLSTGALANAFGSWNVKPKLINTLDLNGDGKQDILIGPTSDGYWHALISQGNSFITRANYISSGITNSNWSNPDTGPRYTHFSDVNGDGLQDILLGPDIYGKWDYLENSRFGFSKKPDPVDHTGSGGRIDIRNCPHTGVWAYSGDLANAIRVVDVTGDGLQDIVVGPRTNNETCVYVNTGDGFKKPEIWFTGHSDWTNLHSRIRMMDVDSDGLNDMVMGPDSSGNWHWLRSTGTSFENMNSTLSAYTDYYNNPHRIHIADANGDSLTDLILSADANGNWYGVGPNAGMPDQLVGITNGASPKTTIAYQSLAQDAEAVYTRNDAVSKTIPMSVVKSVSKGNGVGGENSTTYHYSDLKFDPDGRGTKGFKTVQITDSSTNTVTSTTYHQDFPYVGMPEQVTQTVNGHLISKTENEYRQITTKLPAQNLTVSAIYPVNSRSTEYTYEYGGGSSPAPYKTIVTETGFNGAVQEIDDYGNVKWVKVTTYGADNQQYVKETRSTYKTTDEANWVLGRLLTAEVKHIDPDGRQVTRQSAFDYNLNGQLQSEIVEPGLGNSNLAKTSLYEYDNYGMRNLVTESGFDHDNIAMPDRSATATTTYELWGTEPSQKTVVSNSLDELETSWISLLHGGQIAHMGPNRKLTTTEYDGFGRAIKTTSHLGVTATTSYNWTNQEPLRSVYSITKKTLGLDDQATVYYDALNREIRTSTRTLDGRFALKDTHYNAKGLIESANRPYLSYSTPVWLCYQYDELGRMILEDAPGANLGSPSCFSGNRAISRINHSGLTTTYTNPLGRVKTETRNVMDKVTRVDEAVGTEFHSWLDYSYDPMLQLETIKDANGKVTRLQYDNNGRKLVMDDPSMGHWTYAYNSFDELELQTDAKLRSVVMKYDELGRMEERIDDEGVWIWTYGTLGDINAVGKLLRETGPNGFEKSYSYNVDLQLESTTLNQTLAAPGLSQSETLSTSYTYDGYGRLFQTTYPEDFKTQNEYNRYGQMVAVKSPSQTLSNEARDKIEARRIELLAKAAAAETEATTYLNQAMQYQGTAIEYEVYAMGLLRLEGAEKASAGLAAEELYEAANSLRDISLALIDEARLKQNDAIANATLAKSLEQEILNGTKTDVYNSHRFAALTNAEVAINKLDKAKSIIAAIKSSNLSLNYASTTVMLNEAENYLDLALTSTAGFQDQQALADRYYRFAQSIDADLGDTAATVWWRAAEADAEGRISKSLYGNGTITDRVYDPNNGHLLNVKTSDGVTALHSISYEYDHLNNVKKRTDDTLDYSEDFAYDDLDRLETATLSAGSLNAGRGWTYDKTGNIAAVDGVAFNYENNTEPNLANQLLSTPSQTAQFSYDANGNIESSGGRSYTYTSFNKPNSLTDGSKDARFTYGADKSRINKVNLDSGLVTKTTAYFGAYQKITDTTTGNIEHKYHISAGGALIAVYSKKTDSGGMPTANPVSNYLHKDALGSVTLITDNRGLVVDRLAYTPFGIRRNLDALDTFTSFTSLLLPSFDPAITKRGYTGHEHIDELDLIHMNGRVYDPYIGRFLSPDPTVQMPKSTQGFNRYAYVQNNPLKYTDPSGFFLKRLFKKVKNFVRKYGAQLVSLAIAIYAPGLYGWNAFQTGFAAGFASGFIASGGDLKAAITGGLWGGISAQLAFEIGHGSLDSGGLAGNAFRHGIAQGSVSDLRGGKFKDGFLGGFVGHIAPMPPGLQKMGKTASGIAARTIYAALMGGVSAKLGGGKFDSGARSAAFVHLFNGEGVTQSLAQRRATPVNLTENQARFFQGYGPRVGGVPGFRMSEVQDYIFPDMPYAGSKEVVGLIGDASDLGVIVYPPAAPVLGPISLSAGAYVSYQEMNANALSISAAGAASSMLLNKFFHVPKDYAEQAGAAVSLTLD